MYQEIVASISKALNGQFTETEINNLLEEPKHQHLGDISLPCFTFAKNLKKAPNQIAQHVSKEISSVLIQRSEVVGGYLNLFLDKHMITQRVLNNIARTKELYGNKEKKHQKVVIDFSSPNIAKPFSMGHLRSTVIGNALANIAQRNGYEVIKVNHLGDWGTQFGKLIVAYKLWGNKEIIKKAPIQELLKLYVKFHDEAEHDEELQVKARAAFKLLEENNQEALSLWQWFKEVSLQEFQSVYEILGIQFDSFEGEAFYNDKMQTVVDELNDKGLLILSDGANVVDMDDMPPCLIKKQDGATLYATRDLAAAFYRQQHYKPSQIVYVVGNEQSLHFKQVFKVIEKMGYEWWNCLQHIPFGMILKDGKKMSTRKGKVVLLKDVLHEAIALAEHNIGLKNPRLPSAKEVAKQVGVGAVIFHDLKNFRLNDIEFSMEQMMNFEGETGPYVQYTYARIVSVLRKAEYKVRATSPIHELGDQAWAAVLLLQQFPQTIEHSFEQKDPSIVAKYALQLARSFNKYYGNTRILVHDEQRMSRLLYCYSVAIVLKEALRLLGIAAPEEM